MRERVGGHVDSIEKGLCRNTRHSTGRFTKVCELDAASAIILIKADTFNRNLHSSIMPGLNMLLHLLCTGFLVAALLTAERRQNICSFCNANHCSNFLCYLKRGVLIIQAPTTLCKVSLPYLMVQRSTFIYIIYSPLTLCDPPGYL